MCFFTFLAILAYCVPLLCRSLECKAYRDLGELTGCSVQFRYCLRLKIKFVHLFWLIVKCTTNFPFRTEFRQKLSECMVSIRVNQRSVRAPLAIWFSNTKSVWLDTQTVQKLSSKKALHSALVEVCIIDCMTKTEPLT